MIWAGQHPRNRDFCTVIKHRYYKSIEKNIRQRFFSLVLFCFCSLYIKIIRLVSLIKLHLQILCSYETACHAVVDMIKQSSAKLLFIWSLDSVDLWRVLWKFLVYFWNISNRIIEQMNTCRLTMEFYKIQRCPLFPLSSFRKLNLVTYEESFCRFWNQNLDYIP